MFQTSPKIYYIGALFQVIMLVNIIKMKWVRRWPLCCTVDYRIDRIKNRLKYLAGVSTPGK